MNSRIQELAEQAADRGVGGEFFGCNKLAELIIRECLEVALAQKQWVEKQNVFSERDRIWNKARIQQSQHIVDKIKENFGVEQ
jgi:hypothetical protein